MPCQDFYSRTHVEDTKKKGNKLQDMEKQKESSNILMKNPVCTLLFCFETFR